MRGPHLHVAERSASYQVVKNIEAMGWPTVPLSEAVEINPKADRSLLTDDTEVTFVPMAAVEAASGRVDISTVRRYEEVKKGYTHFRDGDVLFAKITPCMENGKMAVASNLRNGIGLGSTEFHVLRPRKGVNPHYVYYFVSSRRYRSEAAHHMTGAVGQKRVPVSFLEHSEIPLPSQTEQREIVAEIEKQFSRLDEAVAGLKRVKANIKRYKAAILKAAVEGRLVPTEAELARREGRSFETGAQLLQRILEARHRQWQGKGKYKEPVAPDTTDLPELPEGWTWASAEQLCDFITKGTTPVAEKLSDGGGEVQFLKVYNLTFDGVLNYQYKPAFVSQDTHNNELARSKVRPGDVLINIVGPPLGQVSVVPDSIGEANINQAIARFRPVAPIDSAFLALLLRCQDVMRWAISRAKTTSGQSNLTLELCRLLPMPLPSHAEQHRIVAEVDRLLSIAREAETEVDTNLKRAQGLRQGILAAAFSPDSRVPS